MTNRAVAVFAPASVGNFIAGFDVLGAAIAPIAGPRWGDTVHVGAAAEARFSVGGPNADQVPAHPDANLAMIAARALCQGRGLQLPAWHVALHKGLPAGSGLGSSSCSAVAGAAAAAWWLDGVALAGAGPWHSWRRDRSAEILAAAAVAEKVAAGAGHFDNIAPCLLGGLQLCSEVGPLQLPWPDDWPLVVARPQLQLATATARAALPPAVPLPAAAAHAGRLATFVHALHAGDRGLAARCLRDELAEPHRAPLVPGFAVVKAAALAAGALACSFSGAGPAMLAVCAPDTASAVAAAMQAAWVAAGVAASAAVCQVDPRGAEAVATDAVFEHA